MTLERSEVQDSARSPKGPSGHAELAVARRYLDHGFLDVALRMFRRNRALATAGDWTLLVGRLLERGRVAEAVDACQTGGLPLPRQHLLALGDRALRRKAVEEAIHYYELADADREHWSALLDLLTRLPAYELLAIQIAGRHLAAGEEAPAPLRLVATA